MKKLRKYLEIITLFFVTIFVLTLPEEGIIYGQPLTPPRPVSVYFEYSMQDRFGMDSNGDGLIDHNYSRNYVRPPLGYTVIFDGCPSSSGGRGPIVSYTWNVIGPGNSTSIADSSCKQTINLREGVHTVTLTITLQDGKTYSKTQRIAIEDILIVSIGDSYSSGEGNPDREQQFDSLGFVERGPVWQDRQCHRSANAYPAQAAIEIERSDPHTSVTFVSYSCSGASIAEGLIRDFEGREPAADGRRIPAQILQVPEAIGGRTVDILLISAGGNDVGFSDIIRGCIEINRCYEEPTIRNNLNSAFSSLPGLYDRLAADIKERFAVSNTLITEYPDPTHNSRGSFCSPTPEMVSQQDPFIEVYEDEWKWTYENVLTRLNQEVKNAADRNGWTYVGGISSQFGTHGYCAQDQRWFRTWDDSRRIQGPSGPSESFEISTGTMHHNLQGHTAHKNILVQHIQSLAGPPKMHASVEPYSITNRVQETFTVRTEDTRSHQPVTGMVMVGNQQVGTTNSPFTYAFNATGINNAFRVESTLYADVIVPVSIAFPALQVSPEPTSIGLGRQVTVTIFAIDGTTGDPVNGKILTNEGFPQLNRSPIGDTNTPFTHTFHMASRPATEEERGEDGQPRFVHEFPTVTVVSPGYETTEVHIVFRS